MGKLVSWLGVLTAFGFAMIATTCTLHPAYAKSTAHHQGATGPAHIPSATCSDYDLEEARITDLLKEEPDRPHLIATGYALDVFKWNMKWAFDIDVDADKLYVIYALTSHSSVPHVHLFALRNGCITRYKLTWGRVVSEMLRADAWERGHPPVEGQEPLPVPPNRPVPPS